MAKSNFYIKNKEIFLLKLSITNACNMRCRYCFVRKKDEFMDFPTAQKAIRFFLFSRGINKILILYGGEPLLNPIWQDIIIFAKEIAKSLNKKLVVAMATNGLLLDERNLLFLKKHKVALSISIDGRKLAHTANKKYINIKHGYSLLLKKISLATRILKGQSLSALMTIDPGLSHNLYSNFKFIIKLGFTKVHIDPVHGLVWQAKQKQEFLMNFKRILDFVLKRIENKKYIFINPLFNPANRLFFEVNFKNEFCPFYKDLEIYPMGEIAFSQFLLNSPIKKIMKSAIIGNIKEDYLVSNKYKKCYPDSASNNCQHCLLQYYNDIRDPKLKGAELVRDRDKILGVMIRNIYYNSVFNNNDRDYLMALKKQINLLI